MASLNSVRDHIALDLRVGTLYTVLNVARRTVQNVLPLDSAPVKRLNKARIGRLQRWFAKEFRDVLVRWWDSSETACPFDSTDDACIWMVWMQGADKLPDHLTRYVDSVKRMNPERELRLLGFDEVCELIDIPETILHKYEQGTISPVFLTDIIRFRLLERYGGIWMDCTIYQDKPTPDMILRVPTWNVKGLAPYPYDASIPDSHGWQSYYLAAQPHALFCKVMADLLDAYCERCDGLIDYFTTFYLAQLARTVPAVHAGYELIANNNTRCEQLMVALERSKTVPMTQAMAIMMDEDTWIYKGSSHLDTDDRRRCAMLLEQVALAEAVQEADHE